MSDQMPFPFNNFTYFFTLFSKFFSSFHHCTCSLSVSRQYLALDGIYHPLRAAFPNNSTLRRHFTKEPHSSPHGILTLYDVLFQGT
ncbi:YLR154W-A-like protein [Saccharomyces kudriavzevii IFO 1802]|uniref:YLR154W-A-like protein n=1 Tax=Saccharomyces kudriavzevii (strain ATCC MYA-4449 / AS 2.2408 / CBS 8840 / NBRC 1802 / NCYC 2889) TaxID=226230 RepID=J5PKU6_SACK1|nr:YLR154W-A-like protein [Saccharomyces kudriavzevii IFO 1802]